MAVVTGTLGGDQIRPGFSSGGVTGQVTDLADTVEGLGGHDSIDGGWGNDRILGGTGDDTLRGDAGNDTIIGGPGHENIQAGDGDDLIDASTGDAASHSAGDYINPGRGTNTMIGHAALFLERGFGIQLAYGDVRGSGGIVVTVGANGTGTAISNVAGVVNDSFTYANRFDGTRDADRMTGSANANWEGWGAGGGADTIDGGAGHDELLYHLDAQRGGAIAVTVNFATGRATDAFGDTDWFSGMEAARGTALGDRFIGNAGAAYLEYRGLGGADTIEGTTGFDQASHVDDERYGGDAGIVARLDEGTIRDGFGSIDVVSLIDRVRGTSFADTMIAGADRVRFEGEGGADSLRGGAGTDSLFGGAGNDSIEGGIGADRLIGGAGADTLVGGPGFDRVQFDSATSGVQVNLAEGWAQDGEGGTDLLIGIESAIGSRFRDTLTGAAGVQFGQLRGGLGNDLLRAPEGSFYFGSFVEQTSGVRIDLSTGRVTDATLGADTLEGLRGASMFGVFNDTLLGTAADEVFGPERGADSVDGLGGFDIVAYWDATAGVRVDLASGRATDDAGGLDSLAGIEAVFGGAHADTLLGSAGQNVFQPGLGADTINGRGGFDILDYGFGASGHYPSGLTNLPNQGIVLDLTTGRGTDQSGATDVFTGIEGARGAHGADSLRGNSLDNLLAGNDGADTLDGQGGADTLEGGEGDDSISGGTDADVLRGGRGIDALRGGTGPDRFVFASAEELTRHYLQDFEPSGSLAGTERILDLGSGDLVDLSAITGTVRLEKAYIFDYLGGQEVLSIAVDLPATIGTDRLLILPGFTGRLTETAPGSKVFLADRVKVVGTAGGNVLTGTEVADVVEARSGSDRVNALGGDDLVGGEDGADTLSGGAGADTLVGGRGADSLSGGAGNDLLILDSIADSIHGGAGESGVDTVHAGFSYVLADGLEHLALLGTANIRGSGNDAANRIEGNGGNNLLLGFGGRDTLLGHDGADTLDGGAAADTLQGGAGADVFRFRTPAEAAGDKIQGFEVGLDRIALSAAGFGGGLAVEMSLAASGRFAANTTGKATSAAGIGQFVFETDAKRLWWDADGTGAGAAVVVATLTSGVTTGFSAADLMVIA